MISIRNKEIGYNSLVLRFFGIVTMVLGSIGYMKGYGYDWLESFNWTSLAIFAFLLCEGCKKTTNKRLYIRRFLVFTVISEVFYDYFRYGRFFTVRVQSVMCLMLMGLLSIMLCSWVRKKLDNVVIDGLLILALAWIARWIITRYSVSMGWYGYLIIMLFYVSDHVKYPGLLRFFGLFYLAFFLSTSGGVIMLNLSGIQYPISQEAFALLALLFIWPYNGSRGPNSLPLQVCLYSAYPIILVVMNVVKIARRTPV